MAITRQELEGIITRLEELTTRIKGLIAKLPKEAEKPVAVVPRPAVPKPTLVVKSPVSQISAQLSLLAASARTEVDKLAGPKTGKLVAYVTAIQSSKTIKEMYGNAVSAVREAQGLGEDQGVDVLALLPYLNEIRSLTVGNTDDVTISGETDTVIDETN